MGVTFDHVEGVVQKASESPAPTSGASEASPSKPAQESHEEIKRRMERMARRLHAD